MCLSVAFVGSCPQGCPCRWVAPFGACMGSLVAPLFVGVFVSCLVRCRFDVWFVWVSGLSFWVLHSLFFCFFVAAPGRSLACWVVSVAVACRHFVFVVFSLSFLFASLLFSLGCPWWTLLCAHRQFGGTFSAHTVDAQCTLDCACPHAW